MNILTSPRYVFELLEEIILMLLSPWTFLLNRIFGPWLESPAIVQPKPQIVIVNTWVHKSPLHWFWKWYLQRKGFRTAIAYFSLRHLTFQQSAEELKKYFDENDLHDIIIVAISSGALNSLLYLQEMGGWQRVSRFISIGSPFRGSPAAVLLYFIKPMRALLPNSAFIAEISQQSVQCPERMVCLCAVFDELVPSWSSCLASVRRLTVDVVGHDNLHSLSKATYDEVAKIAAQALTAKAGGESSAWLGAGGSPEQRARR